MLLALGNTAKFYKDGKISEVQGKDLMSTAAPYNSGYTGFAFVAYPNRDSTPFKEKYNIPEAKTIIRGTLRYAGFPELVKTIVDIGFLSQEQQDFLHPSSKPTPWVEATSKILGSSSNSEADLIWTISSKTTFKDTEEKTKIINALKWIGLFSQEPIMPRNTPLDTLCATLEKKCAYAEGERDLVFLQHTFGIEHKDGRRETRTSTLCEYGNPKGSAMARTVGIPCGVAVTLCCEGKLGKGLKGPYSEELCAPLRKELLEVYGIEMIEKTID